MEGRVSDRRQGGTSTPTTAEGGDKVHTRACGSWSFYPRVLAHHRRRFDRCVPAPTPEQASPGPHQFPSRWWVWRCVGCLSWWLGCLALNLPSGQVRSPRCAEGESGGRPSSSAADPAGGGLVTDQPSGPRPAQAVDSASIGEIETSRGAA